MRILLIDNYDSFTYLLVTYFKELGQTVTVVTEADALATQVRQSPDTVVADYQAIVISPGPKTPKEAAFSRQVVTIYAGRLPILGVCLGHQVIADVFGGQVVRGDRPQHGVTATLTHNGQGFLTGLPQKLQVARYHSLIVTALPPVFCVDARSEDGVIQAMHHQTLPIWSVQFHPESWMTAHGYDMLNNFLEQVRDFEKI